MRNLPPLPPLAQETRDALQRLTDEIVAETDEDKQKKLAESHYTAARGASKGWFKPVIDCLHEHNSWGAICVYCSSSVASQLEHYRPKSVYPCLALTYDNFLWICGICNTKKGNRFPETEADRIIHPVEDEVWDYFRFDDQGNLQPRWDTSPRRPKPRAKSTIDLVGITNNNFQKIRRSCYRDLVKIFDALNAKIKDHSIPQEQLQQEIAEHRNEPSRPDVADFFLNGPGRKEEPFRSVLLAAGETVPE